MSDLNGLSHLAVETGLRISDGTGYNKEGTPGGSLRYFILFFAIVASTAASASNVKADSGKKLGDNDLKKIVAEYQAGQYTQIEKPLRQAVAQAGPLLPFFQYYLADTLVHLKKFDEVTHLTDAILKTKPKPSAELKYKTLFLRSQVFMRSSKWREASRALHVLQRHWSFSPNYPEVLLRSIRTDLKLGRRSGACHWARKLYVRYPTNPLVVDWPANFHEVKVDDQKIGCQMRSKDFQSRIRHLQWAGEGQRARKEIEEIRALSPKKIQPKVDMMLARFLVNEGLVEDALNLLVRYYPKKKKDFDYLRLLAYAAARAGEYQTAVGAYEKAHKLSPHSRKGREALFQAAFLSYQFQDYDGAVRKFKEFIKEHPRSGLSRDAKWHLAWLQYLRSDFKGALKQFQQVRQSASRRRHFKGSHLDQRLLYWTAMSYVRLNQLKKGESVFHTLLKRSPYSFYAVEAHARLAQLGDDKPTDGKPGPDQRDPASLLAASAMATVAVNDQADKEDAVDAEETESEDQLSDGPDAGEEMDADADAGDDVETGDDADEDAEQQMAESEPIEPSSALEPVLRARLENAQHMVQLGMTDFAKWELWEVERRVRQPADRKLLIAAYEQSGLYHRSAAIAELRFGGERTREGLDGARSLWLSMFPQAFKKVVGAAAQKNQIPQDWIWSIMRAESRYRTDVISPVGAKGLMQLMPFTARNVARINDEKSFHVDDLFDPIVNINLGAKYLARLSREFNGSLPLVAAAYNAGPHRVQGWLVSFGHLETDEFIEHIPFLETRNYVKKVVLNRHFYKALYSNDPGPMKWLAQPLGVPIPTKVPARENWGSI